MDDGGRTSLVLTFGPSQHEAEALAVLLLQEHRLLLDYIVTAGGDETDTEQRVSLQVGGFQNDFLFLCLPLPAPPLMTSQPALTVSSQQRQINIHHSYHLFSHFSLSLPVNAAA